MVAGNLGLEPAVSPSAAGAMARAQRMSTARPPRRAIHRPCAEECLATGWIRPCPYTPRCVQVGPPPDAPNAATLQWFRGPGSKFLSEKYPGISERYRLRQRHGARARAAMPRRSPQLKPGRRRPGQTMVATNAAHRPVAPICVVRRLAIAHCLAFRRRPC
jgi:hypothetical protein